MYKNDPVCVYTGPVTAMGVERERDFLYLNVDMSELPDFSENLQSEYR